MPASEIQEMDASPLDDTRQQRLAATLKERRESLKKSNRKRWTQEAVAERLGVAQTYISALERGIIEKPHFGRLVEIAAAYELDANDLLVNSGWPDVSTYVAEYEETKKIADGMTGARAVVVERLRAFPETATPRLLNYMDYLSHEHALQEEGPEYELGEDGEFIRIFRSLPPTVKAHIKGITIHLSEARQLVT